MPHSNMPLAAVSGAVPPIEPVDGEAISAGAAGHCPCARPIAVSGEQGAQMRLSFLAVEPHFVRGDHSRNGCAQTATSALIAA